MVYMQGRGRYNASRSNQTSHYGIMAGLRPYVGTANVLANRANSRQIIPPGAIPGLHYMREHDLLSVNPAGSGGIGRTRLLISRAM